jgi:hypothetical protein
MKTQDLVLLPQTVYGTPSGNYDGSSDTDFAGDRQKAVGYYRQPAGVQSVMIETTGLQGDIDIQATLDADPAEDGDWFLVDTVSSGTHNISLSVKGNFTWIRARVRGFTGGVINSVTVTY